MKTNFLSLKGMRLKGRSMNDPEITRKSRGNHPVITRFSRLITSTLLLLFTLAIGNVWAEDVTWEGDNTVFVDKKLSDEVTTITVTKDASNSSKKISCINSTSNKQYLSINGGGKYLKFAAPSGYTITNIQMVWMSGAANQALPILFGESISAVGTVESKDKAVTITNGGFMMTNQIATSAGTNCDSPDDIALPSGTKQVMIGRSGAYSVANYTIGEVEETVKFRLAGASGSYFTTAVGAESTPFIGRVTLTIASSTVAPTISAPTADQSATYTVGDEIAALTVTASGTPTPTYQWYYNSSASTEGATSLGSSAQTASYTPSNAAASDLYYYCVATNSAGTATSPYFHVTINAPSAPTHSISYTNTKGATNTNPDTYYEGIGIPSFDPLADVTDFHFTGWDPASISDTEDQDVEVEAQWVAAYNVSFNAGAGSGTVPTTFQKWNGATFNLPGQGDMVAPSGKVFDGWKAGGTKYAAGAEYEMGNAAVEFVAQWKSTPTVLFHYQQSNLSGNLAAGSYSATGGTLTTSAEMSKESASYNAAVPTDMKGGANVGKLGSNAAYIQLTLASGTFQEGDTVYICGYKSYKISTSTSVEGDVAASVTTGTSKTDYNVGFAVIPSGVDQSSICLSRAEGTGTGFAAVKVIRPAAREIASTVITLSDVKVNGRSISSDSLAILKTASAYALTLKDEFASAPEIKFNEHTVITYADGESPATKETDKVYTVTATEVSSQWQAQQTIDGITYTVNAPKVSSATVTYYDGATKLGEEVVAVGGYATAFEITTTREHYTFDGWYNDAGLSDGPVTLASTVINADKDFYGSWTENAKAAVTFQVDGAQYGDVQNVYVGDKVASVDSPTKAGNVFQGWYNGESKFDFTAAIASGTAITLDAKWAAADANHYVYAYNDDFHYDGVVYKTPEGKVDAGSGTSNIAMTTPYTLFSGADGITSVVMTDGIYDSKTGAIQAVTALMKVNNNATSKLTITIKSGYTAVLKIKASGYSATRTISVSDATPASGTTSGQAVTSGAMSVAGIGELSFALNAGSHDLTVTGGTLYIAELDLEATALTAYTVTYKPGEGTGSDVVDDDATQVNDCPNTFTAPEGKIFNGWKDALDADVAVGAIVEGDMTLTAQWINHYAVTFNMNDHGSAIPAQDIKHGSKATEPDDPFEIGYDFGGWFTDNGTFENQFDFNTAITAATPLYAKWTAFDGCVLLYPALSGSTIAIGDEINMQTGSKGATMEAVVKSGESSSTLVYNENGLSFASSGNTSRVKVTLGSEIAIDTKISITIKANGANTSARGLDLYNAAAGNKKTLGWAASTYENGDVATFSYTAEESDGYVGTNEFYLYRNNSVFLQSIKVESCGSAITFHNLTSAVDPAGKGTVTLGASSVREGHSTTATYSDIDPLYEFVNWTVSGEGASVENATANPATITMGTENAVVTLNLRLIPVKFTVNYYDGTTLMGSEQVAVNEHPTASEIATAKRGYVFEGWAETDGASASDVVALNTITSDVAATIDLYAVYTAVPCPTSGTVYKFQLKTDLTNGNVFDSKPNSVAFTTDNYLSELTGGTLTGAIDNNNVNRLQFYDNKAVGFASGSGGSLTIALDCALAEGDVIKYINYASSGNRMTLSDGTHTQTLDGNGKEEIQTWDVPAAWAGAMDLTLTRGGNTPKLTYFEINRRPVVTGVTLSDLTVRVGAKKTPEMTLAPSADARVNSQAWTITSGDTYITIDAATGEITGVAEGDATVKVVLNDDPSISATATVHVVGSIAQQDVTKSTIWDWHNTGATADIQLTNDTDPKKNEQFVLANVNVDNDDEFESDKLVVEGEYMVRDYNKTNPYFQGQLIKFSTTVAGAVRVKFSNTGGNPARELYVNGVGTGNTSANGTLIWSDYVEVPAGEVSITAYLADKSEDASQKYIRVSEIEFLALADRRDGSWVAPGELGTVCLKDDAKVMGARVYELKGANEHGYMVFDEILDGEIEAGNPYLFEATRSGNVSFYKPVGATHTETAGSDKGMIGTFVDETLTPGTGNYCYFSGRHIWRVNDFNVNIPIPAYRCYVDYDEFKTHPVSSPNPAPGHRRVVLGLNGEQVATGVENAELLNGAGVQKVLINGEIYILRGEKMYNVNGQIVK